MNIQEKNSKILITGGSGFIGTNVIEYLLSKNIKLLNVDINEPKIKNHFEFWRKVDILDYTKLAHYVSNFNPTHVLHLAASLGMEHNSLDTLGTNIDGVKNIIKVSNKVESIKKVVFTSSLLVCKNGYIPEDESDYCPPNFYGESKMLGEKLVRDSTTHFNWAIVRPTSIWGRGLSIPTRHFFKQ